MRARLRRHAELSGTEHGLDFLGRGARQRDLEVVDEARAVHSDRRNEAALHQIDQHRPKADFDDVRAETPHDSALCGVRLANGRDHRAEVCGGQQVWKRVDPAGQTRGRIPGASELFGADFARTIGQGMRSDSGEIEFVVSEFHAAHSINMASP